MKTPRIRKARGLRCFLAGIASVWVAMALAAACGGPASGERGPAAPPYPPPGPGPLLDAAWDVHPISLRYRGANGLGRADVSGNGLTDYVTNYEFDQRVVISLHPGPGADPRAPWEQVEIFTPFPLSPEGGINPESACFGDFDGDGRLDVALAQGQSNLAFWEGNAPGVRLFWGSGGSTPSTRTSTRATTRSRPT